VEATTDYLLLPFNRLDEIVATKKIPFVPHARLLREVEAKHPGVFDLERMPLPESYHLHEAAHVIAEGATRELAAGAREDRVLKAILCESFANTVDAMACGFAETEIHRMFLKLNCYMHPDSVTRELMARVRASVGETMTARLVLLSYICANFLREGAAASLVENWLENFAEAGAPGEGAMSDVWELSAIGERLDPLFRLQTTQNYFQLQGFKGPVEEMLDFDFVARLQREDFARAVAALVSLLAD
jgi:hypothetical protein